MGAMGVRWRRGTWGGGGTLVGVFAEGQEYVGGWYVGART